MARSGNTTLREFVYLDEVSVFSLIASRLGAVAKEFTETESSSLTAEVGSAMGVSAVPLKADVSSRLEGSRTVGAQVVRKSIVQSTFKELLDHERPGLALRPPSTDDDVPAIDGVDDLGRLAEDAVSGWVIDPAMLRRGHLFEVEVELDAEEIFRLTTILNTVLEMMRENPELMPINDQEGLRQAAALTRVLDKLLVGLIPIRGRAVGYRYITLDGHAWLVSTRLLDRLPGRTEIEPLFVVGVTEASLFWKDIRRVLFTGARYSVMGRVGRPGVQGTWTPIKLADVLKDVAPDLSRQFDGVREQFVNAFVAASDPVQASDEEQRTMDAVIEFCLAVGEHYGLEYDREAIIAEGLHLLPSGALETVDGQRKAFAGVASGLHARFGVTVEDTVMSDARTKALTAFKLDSLSKLAPTDESGDVVTESGPPVSGRYLDAEIVAVYW